MLALLLFACARPAQPLAVETAAETAEAADPPARRLLRGGHLPGEAAAIDLLIEDGRIVALGAGLSAEGAAVEELGGKTLVPAFIDSHVHLAYLAEGPAMAAGGIAAAVDLAAPLPFLAEDHGPLRVIAAGPMITAIGGYPTTSWGRDGYGIECADAAAAVQAADQLMDAGAGLLKLPLTGRDQLPADAIAAVADRAHARGRRLAVHALGEAEAAQAAALGADLLAHTPTEPLAAATLAAWRGRAVVSTLAAFGDSPAARSNLAALVEAGATLLYGTDFGNTRSPGISSEELEGLLGAGFTPAQVLAAGTTAPAAYWGLADLGSLEVGKAASLLILEADPLDDPLTLAHPAAVYLDGVKQEG